MLYFNVLVYLFKRFEFPSFLKVIDESTVLIRQKVTCKFGIAAGM